MNMKAKLKEKIEKSKKLVEEFKQCGINATLDEVTGEITIPMSEWNKPEVIEYFENNNL